MTPQVDSGTIINRAAATSFSSLILSLSRFSQRVLLEGRLDCNRDFNCTKGIVRINPVSRKATRYRKINDVLTAGFTTVVQLNDKTVRSSLRKSDFFYYFSKNGAFIICLLKNKISKNKSQK